MKINIKVKGNLDKSWSTWFEDLEIKHDGKYTVLVGLIADHSELHGILNKIRDLNLKLVSVESENGKI